MATFKVQIEDTVGSVGDDTALTSWLTDGAKEIINMMPEPELSMVSAQQTFTSAAVGSEAETLNTGKILHVFRNDGDIDQPCRPIQALYKGRASDPYDMQYASITDPVFYIENNKLNALPDGGSCKYSEVQFPAVAHGDSAISVFPDEYEYLVVLYAAIKGLQRRMSDKLGNSDITTAMTAINTELDETQAVCDKVDADLVLAKAEVVLAKAEAAELATQTDNGGDFETACDAMATELAKVDNVIVEASAEFDKVDDVIVEGSVEFDKVDNVIVEGSAELDKSSALLDLGETDSEGAVNTAAAKIITEMDET